MRRMLNWLSLKFLLRQRRPSQTPIRYLSLSPGRAIKVPREQQARWVQRERLAAAARAERRARLGSLGQRVPLVSQVQPGQQDRLELPEQPVQWAQPAQSVLQVQRDLLERLDQLARQDRLALEQLVRLDQRGQPVRPAQVV